MEPNQTGQPTPEGESYSVLETIRASSAVRDLFARRSRRVTLATRLDGPLGHEPREPRRVAGRAIPAPITKEEEAYLVAAAVGITGPVQADLPYTPEGGGRTMMNLYGRTIASPDAAHTQRLIVLNDAGSWFIKGPQDFAPDELPQLVELVQQGRWIEWYDRMRVRISERRAEIPREIPYQAPFNIHSTNLPGTTYFLPIADISGFCLNVVFSGFEKNVGVVLHDLRNGLAPAGIEKDSLRSRGGPLNDLDSDMQGTVEYLSELIRGWTGNERGQMFANLARAAQELNLDGFPHFGGRLSAWAEELDFQMLRVSTAKLTRGSSKLRNLGWWLMLQPTPYSVASWLRPPLRRQVQRHTEIPLALQRDGEWLIRPYCPPFYESMEAAVRAFVDRKFGALLEQLDAAVSDLQPDKAGALAQALERYTQKEIRMVAGFAQYCLDRYGVFPYCGEPGPLSSQEAFQVHVADPEYYRDHYRAPLTQGQIARATRPLADGTDVGDAPTGAPDPLEVDGAPPWQFEADHVLLLYDVPAERVSQYLPRDFEPVTHGEGGVKAEILVGFNHIVEFRSKDLKWVPPYDEIMVSVRVRHRSNRSEGSFYLKLHLDQRIPLDMGVVHFGYPKERAHIQRYEREGRIRYRAQRGRKPLYELEITPRERFSERLRALGLWGLYRLGQVFLDPGSTRAFFLRGSETLQTSWVATPKASALRFAKLDRVEFPFLVENLKILEHAEAQKPKLAMHSHTSKGRSAEAEAIPARISRSVRWRLAWVGQTKPLMDAAVRWLGR